MSFMKTVEVTRLFFQILPWFLQINFLPLQRKQFAVAVADLQSAVMFMELCLPVFQNPELVTNGVIAIHLPEQEPIFPEPRVLLLLRIHPLPHSMWQAPIMFTVMPY